MPILNEVGSVCTVVDGVLSLGTVDRLLIIDDGSTDGTLDELARLRERWPQVDVVVRRNQRGLGSALMFGFREALSRYPFERLVVLDGDLSHDPATIPDLLSVSSDLVIGSRYTPGGRIENWELGRRIVSFGANFVARHLLHLPVRDVTSGFRVYSRQLVELIIDRAGCGGYELEVETIWLAVSHNYSIAETPITFVERKAGESKLATADEAMKFLRFVALKTVPSWRGRPNRPPRAPTRRSS